MLNVVKCFTYMDTLRGSTLIDKDLLRPLMGRSRVGYDLDQ